jgi:hypothetical protein
MNTATDLPQLDQLHEMHLRRLDSECRQGEDMHTLTALITPAVAKAWLTRNVVNRPVCKRNLAKFKWALRNGAFQCTPQGLAFNLRGELVDGQHRLRAVVDTGIAAPMRVTFGFDGDVRDAFDIGKSRSIADIVHRSARCVATCAALALLEDGQESVAAEHNERVYQRNKASVDWALEVLGTRRYMTSHVLAALAFAHPTARESIEGFANELANYCSPFPDAPAVTFRRFLERRHDGAGGQLRLMHATLHALRAHVTGKRPVRITSDESSFSFFAKQRAHVGL